MSNQMVRKYFRDAGMEHRVMEFEKSSATVKEAAQAVGCQPKQIAKTMSFFADNRPILIVTAGDAKISNKKYKDKFHQKAKMIPAELVEAYTGHIPGGVCPFVNKSDSTVYLDISLKRFREVYPAAGDDHSTVRLSIEELENYSGAKEWIDICQDWVEDE